MTVIVVDKPSQRLRGLLKLWYYEMKPGVFVGNVSALVRMHSWHLVQEEQCAGAVMAYDYPTEQGLRMEMFGLPKRSVVELDGMQLISIKNERSK